MGLDWALHLLRQITAGVDVGWGGPGSEPGQQKRCSAPLLSLVFTTRRFSPAWPWLFHPLQLWWRDWVSSAFMASGSVLPHLHQHGLLFCVAQALYSSDVDDEGQKQLSHSYDLRASYPLPQALKSVGGHLSPTHAVTYNSLFFFNRMNFIETFISLHFPKLFQQGTH